MTTWAVHLQHSVSERLWRRSGGDCGIDRVKEESGNARDGIASGAQNVMLHPTRERSACQSVFSVFIESVGVLRTADPVAAEAILALRVPLLERALPPLNVAGQAILLKLENSMFRIRRDRRAVLLRGGRQSEEDDGGEREH